MSRDNDTSIAVISIAVMRQEKAVLISREARAAGELGDEHWRQTNTGDRRTLETKTGGL
jgi:hypothetical protein